MEPEASFAEAIERGDVEVVKEILEEVADISRLVEDKIIALANRDSQVARQILNLITENISIPRSLYLRTVIESEALFDLFIQQLKDQISGDFQAFNTIALLELAVGNYTKVEPLLEALLRRGYNMTNLLPSAACKSENVLKWAIEHGADPNVNIRPQGGAWPRTVLSRAALHLSPSSVSYLLEHGAHPDSNALHMVLRRQSLEWQRANIRLGPSTGSRYASPLTEQERVTITTTLLDYGADINAVEDGLQYRFSNVAGMVYKGTTALRMAIDNSDLQLVRLLVNRGADQEQASSGQNSTSGGRPIEAP